MTLRAVLVSALFAFAVPAFAQDQSPPHGGGQGPSPEMREAMQAMRKTCEADIKTLCADAASSTDRRAVRQCLRENADAGKLSPDCKAAYDKMRSMMPPRPQ
jgi:hypothetical protein